MTDDLATDLAAAVADFLAHKRALGRKYHTEEATLRLLLAFADRRASLTWTGYPRPARRVRRLPARTRARSFNHLVG